jgi:integrase
MYRPTARRAAWRYLAERDEDDDPEAPLFTSVSGRRLTPNALRILISRLGEKAGMQKCHPHRFRHTFAITYLLRQLPVVGVVCKDPADPGGKSGGCMARRGPGER